MSFSHEKDKHTDPNYQTSDEFLASLGPHRRWFQFGWESPLILYRRLRNKYTPFLGAKSAIQRARRGYSDRDLWSFDDFLTVTIRDGLREWLTWPPTGHPMDLSYDEWLAILQEIVDGMDAALVWQNEGDFELWQREGEAKFNRAMDLLKQWWFHLWD